MDFEQSYKDHFPAVYKTCLAKFKNEDFAMEITQEAFTRAFMKLGDLRDESKFLPWVTTIAIHYGYYRARLDQARFNRLPPDDRLGEALISASLGNPGAEAEDLIRRWLLTHKASDQRIFEMKYDYAMSNQEIAHAIRKSLSTVKRRLAFLRSSLKEALEKEKVDE